jgi:hypothetical protein
MSRRRKLNPCPFQWSFSVEFLNGEMMKQQEIKLGAWTLVLTSAAGAHAQGASAPSGQASGASTTPPGGEVWMISIVGGVAGGLVAGVIVAVAVISQLKKSLNAATTAKR